MLSLVAILDALSHPSRSRAYIKGQTKYQLWLEKNDTNQKPYDVSFSDPANALQYVTLESNNYL